MVAHTSGHKNVLHLGKYDSSRKEDDDMNEPLTGNCSPAEGGGRRGRKERKERKKKSPAEKIHNTFPLRETAVFREQKGGERWLAGLARESLGKMDLLVAVVLVSANFHKY